MEVYSRHDRARYIEQLSLPSALLRRLSEQALATLYAFARFSGLLRQDFSPLPYFGDRGKPQLSQTGWGSNTPPKTAPVDRLSTHDHPGLAELRRRATLDLLSWLGVEWVPGRLIDSLRTTPDPTEAVLAFARSVGCQGWALRAREPLQLEIFRTRLKLICQIEGNAHSLTRTEQMRLDSLRCFDRADRADEIERTIVDLNEARAIFGLAAKSGIPNLLWSMSQVVLARRSAIGISSATTKAVLDNSYRMLDLIWTFYLASAHHDMMKKVFDELPLEEAPETGDGKHLQKLMDFCDSTRQELKTKDRASPSALIPAYHSAILEVRAAMLLWPSDHSNALTADSRRALSTIGAAATHLTDAAADYFGIARKQFYNKDELDRALSLKIEALQNSIPASTADDESIPLYEALAWRSKLLAAVR